MNKILVAGATGYLGKFIARETLKRNYYTRVLVRNSEKFKQFEIDVDDVYQAEITDKSSLANCCNDIDVVISSIGITRQQDGLTYMDVDYQGNLNLLEEAKKQGVKKFIYVSVLYGEKLRHLQICEAKEKFVDVLKSSGLNYSIIRPNGFFSDMTEILNMAKKGRVYLFGNGQQTANPIHGEDLAEVCLDTVENNIEEINVGGPENLTHNEIAEIAFKVLNKKVKISYIPNWIRKLILKTSKILMSEKSYGPLEFFMNVMAIDMISPNYGNHTLKKYFSEIKN